MKVKEAPCGCCSGGLIWLGSLQRMVSCPICRGTGLAAETGERKHCEKCGHVKPRSDFGLSGLASSCRACENAVAQRYVTKNRHGYRDKYRDQVFGHYGSTCACCGAAGDLQIDHVNGDGKEHRAEIGDKGGWWFYLWLIRNGLPEGFQTLCGPCNNSKGCGQRCRLWHGGPIVTLGGRRR